MPHYTTRRGLIAALSLITTVVLALGTHAAPVASIEDRLPVCYSCHGENGRPSAPDTPIIAGQEFYYLYVQLKDYAAGRRANPIMSGMVADLDKGQMQALAQHFADRPWPAIDFRTEPADVARGETAAAAGQCVQCHLGGYEGNSRVPRLAGQQPAYLERTMLDFKTKVRLNSPAKGSLLAAYEDADITAMARYLAGF